MGREGWYRRRTWTKTDEEEFFSRLSRSRGAFNKVQYLRIQALHLQEAEMPSQALTLLERAQMDYPEQPGQMGGILMQEAECRWSTGDRAGSFEAYMRALAAQYRYPNVIRAIALSFAQRFYDHDGGSYAGILLDAIGEELKSWSGLEPYMKVRYAVVMARLHSHLNEKSDAGQCAKIALENLRRFVRARLTCNARGRRELARPYNRVGAQGQRGEVNLEPRFVRVSPSRIPILAGACRNRTYQPSCDGLSDFEVCTAP